MQKEDMSSDSVAALRLQKSLKQVDFKIFGGKKMNKYEYTGNKTKNYFTAYLQKCIRWKRQNYLKGKDKLSSMERPLEEDIMTDYILTAEEMLEMSQKEELLLKERRGDYPDWNELSNQKLACSLMLLHEKERRLIYQYVFEKRTFEEIGHLNRMTEKRVKDIYYYAIRKIRKWMGGNNSGF